MLQYFWPHTVYDNNQQLQNKQKMQTVATFVQLSLKKECEKKNINQYIQSNKQIGHKNYS
jgi:hypothetical protein